MRRRYRMAPPAKAEEWCQLFCEMQYISWMESQTEREGDDAPSEDE